MTLRLEHANLVVRDIDATLRFLQTAMPEFELRHGSRNEAGQRWVHVGTPSCYIALSSATVPSAERWKPYAGRPGVNHLAFEVDDASALRQRLRAAGYVDTTVPNEHPARKRVYFSDADGNDWEFVQYLSDDPALRNDYSQPDH
jgi:catechol 2,3-dioxygenase-like lactoylglutathione lyase family enzyme